jgi:hypothetical protein
MLPWSNILPQTGGELGLASARRQAFAATDHQKVISTRICEASAIGSHTHILKINACRPDG